MSKDKGMSNWPYLDDDQDQQRDPAPPRWYENNREYQLERMQDRLDAYVAAMLVSAPFKGFSVKQLIHDAVVVMREVDKAAQQEVDRDENV